MYRTLRLITFDVTNTLITVARDVGSEYAKVASIYGVKGVDVNDSARIAAISTAFRTNFTRFTTELPNFGHQHGLTSVEWWSRLVVQTFQDAGFTEESEQRKIQNTAAHLYKLYSRGSQWTVKEDAQELLFDLRKVHPQIPLGILSNFDERLESILRDLGLTHYFKYHFISKTLGVAKPSTELLEHVLTKAGITNPGLEYLHVGDNVDLDYIPVKAIGGNAILIGKKTLTNPAVNPDDIAPSLKDLRQRLNL